jgi:hypothetical protein
LTERAIQISADACSLPDFYGYARTGKFLNISSKAPQKQSCFSITEQPYSATQTATSQFKYLSDALCQG